MLPEELFAKITAIGAVRSFTRGGDRRDGLRIPIAMRAAALPVVGDGVGRPVPVRVRDLSAHGVGVLSPTTARWGAELVLVLQRRNEDALYLVCEVKRIRPVDASCTVIGCTWSRALYPGLTLAPGAKLSTLLWADVSGEPDGESPFEMPKELRKGTQRRAG